MLIRGQWAVLGEQRKSTDRKGEVDAWLIFVALGRLCPSYRLILPDSGVHWAIIRCRLHLVTGLV